MCGAPFDWMLNCFRECAKRGEREKVFFCNCPVFNRIRISLSLRARASIESNTLKGG
jgi:hypothetical protein